MKQESNEIEVNNVKYVRKDSATPSGAAMMKDFCIVRTDTAGVFAGNTTARTKCGTVRNAIRIFYWEGANSLSQLAMEGTKKPSKCQFAMPVAEVHLTDVIEVIPCTEAASLNITGVESWKA